MDSASYSKQTNADGYADPSVCSHGVEGTTEDAAVNEFRARQLRNLTLALVLARGIPLSLRVVKVGCRRAEITTATTWKAGRIDSILKLRRRR